MPIVKDLHVTLQQPTQVVLGFHDIVGISWNGLNGQCRIDVGSWTDKADWAQNAETSPKYVQGFTFKGIKDYTVIQDLAKKVLELEIFSGGTEDNGK